MSKRSAPKEPTEGTRRSSRTSTTSAAPAAPASKKAKVAAAAPSKKAAAAPKKKEKEVAEEEEDELVEEDKKDKKKGGGVTPVGEVVHDVKLHNEDGEEVSFASLYEKSGSVPPVTPTPLSILQQQLTQGNHSVVLFSYPKASTPGCTTQACGFRDLYDDIAATGYAVFGISADKPAAQLNFKTKQKMQYSLLSDPKKDLLKQLGATEATKRCHWIVEKGGKLLEAKIGVKPADDPKNALAFIKAL
ncbi:hypothetical protein RQP46_008024 [Phenoliferia psychrophenolica]